MSLFPLTYRLCNPIIELPPPGSALRRRFVPESECKSTTDKPNSQTFPWLFSNFFIPPTHKTPASRPHAPGKQKHKRTQKNYGKNTKKTHPGRQTTKNNTEENTKRHLWKKGCSFQTYETLLFAPRATRRGNKILILFYIYFGFGTLVFGYRKTPLAENKKYVPCILKYVRPISKYVRHIFRGFQSRWKSELYKCPFLSL